MYLSLNWLKDFVDIPKKITPEELGLRLTMHTVEIDAVTHQAEKYKNIIVAKILAVSRHPNADKLQIAKVDIKKEKLDIVCGANNIAPGQLVPLALVGSILPGGLEIKEAEIRGVKSCGMLCAPDEIGLGEDHSGILILNASAKPGQPLSEYLKLKDVTIEVDNKSITNRPDLWGHYGLAREIAAFLNVKLKPITADNKNLITDKISLELDVKVEDYKLCPRYMALALSGVKIEESPAWLAERLVAVGVRPVNNIVDITNYVMLELGQPLHAFDAEFLSKSGKAKILVRSARAGETIKTLDGQARQLDENMLLITDGEAPVAVAGVMGGENSEINIGTKDVIFESANFDFVSIRKTSQKLGLRTEASMRYEKSLDPNLCETALVRVIELMKKICPEAKISSTLADMKDYKLNQGPIELDMKWLHHFIGEDIKEKKVISILFGLGFIVEKKEKKLSVTVPTWRATKDISIKEDLAEEVARIYGYDKLDGAMPKMVIKAPEVIREKVLIRKIQDILSLGLGLTEVHNYSFTNDDQVKKMGLDLAAHLRLANPVTANQTVLRQNLAVNLVNTVKINQARAGQISVFEIGSIYLGSMSGEEDMGLGDGSKLPYQEKRIGIALAGGGDLFSKAKGQLEFLINSLPAAFNPPLSFERLETVPDWANTNAAAKIMIDKTMVGSILMLKQKTAQALGVKKEVVIAEVSLKELFKFFLAPGMKKYQEFEKYPSVTRDLAIIVGDKVIYSDIKKDIINFNPLIKKIELFDVYSGDKLGPGRKNLAFHIIYQADKTLTAGEVDDIQAQLIKHLAEKFEAKIRDF